MARTRALDYVEKREIILQQAAQLIARHGYTGTSISMIAEACGVSKALLYHYYPDKEAVLFDILHAHLTDLVTQVDAVVAATASRSGAEQLLAIGETLLDIYRGSHAEHQVQLANLALLPDARQAVKPLTMSWFGMINWHYLWFREDRGISRAEYARIACRLITAGGAEAGRLA